MRNTAFLAFGLGLIMVQSNLFRLIGYGVVIQRSLFGEVTVAGVTPSLLLPLLVFMGVHEYAMWRGALLSFGLGYLLDVFASAPIGLYTFTSVTIFVVSRVAGVRLAAQTIITKVALAFAFSLLESVFVIILTAIFGGDAARPRALATLVLPHALSTALVAPLVFGLAQRVHQATITVPGPGEVKGR
ncbi:MAG: rod shape-determining protein MreD [Myxococcales bacterium]|nr:rod shape-determining protein MreD [Myxococcales bacterium]